MSRLPQDPLTTTDGHFNSETKLVNTLTDLKSKLNSRSRVESNLVGVLLDAIAREMDYDAWLKDADSPKLKEFVGRFRK